jgi:hypothetical protein
LAVGPVLRAVRAAVFAAVCLTLSVAGHEWMSGRSVAPWALLVAAAGVFSGAYLLAARRRGFPSIAALMLAGQAALHALFGLAQGGEATGGWMRAADRAASALSMLLHPHPAADAAWARMAMTGMPGMSGPGACGAASGAGMPGMGHGPGAMLAAHALAGLVCSWWLARGEAQVFGLLLALVMAAFAPLRLAMAACRPGGDVPRTPHAAAAAPVRTRWALLLVHSEVRRGPPTLSAWT